MGSVNTKIIDYAPWIQMQLTFFTHFLCLEQTIFFLLYYIPKCEKKFKGYKCFCKEEKRKRDAPRNTDMDIFIYMHIGYIYL